MPKLESRAIFTNWQHKPDSVTEQTECQDIPVAFHGSRVYQMASGQIPCSLHLPTHWEGKMKGSLVFHLSEKPGVGWGENRGACQGGKGDPPFRGSTFNPKGDCRQEIRRKPRCRIAAIKEPEKITNGKAVSLETKSSTLFF